MTPRQRGRRRYTVSLIVSLKHDTRAIAYVQLYQEEVVGVRVLTRRYPFLALLPLGLNLAHPLSQGHFQSPVDYQLAESLG